ncbi:Sec-independent protein translocase subunit TatA [Parasphingorhabdus pacifica]
MPFNMGATELLIIAGIVILLFGATKLPQMARSLGQSARVFKAEARGMKEDEAAAKRADEDKSNGEQQQLTSPDASTPTSSPVEESKRDDAKN